MKFSHSLQFNAVPEWSSKYINYSGLKKLIYSLQREHAESLNTNADSESQPFTASDDTSSPVSVFLAALDKELEKINKFFLLKEKDAISSYNSLIDEIEEFEREFPTNASDSGERLKLKRILDALRPDKFLDDNRPIDEQHMASPVVEPVLSRDAFESSLQETTVDASLAETDKHVRDLSRKRSHTLFDDDDFNLTFLEALKVEKRKPLANMFVLLSELKSYIELNKIGFSKALKKFDKLMHTKTKHEYMESLVTNPNNVIFKPETLEDLNQKLGGIIKLYSVFTAGNEESAKEELRSNLREYIVWERNTVWRNMIGMERKSQAARVQKSVVADVGAAPIEKFDIHLGAGRKITIPAPVLSGNAFKILFIAMVTVTLLNFSPLDNPQQKNCLAVLVCASLLWATEAIPLFTTSLLLPFLIVVLRTLVDPDTGEPLSPADASKFICSAMWSPIIMLLLGGFTLAAALSKYNLDKIACTFILSKVPQHPAYVLLSIMCVSTVLSAFVSNVAAPVLMYSVVQPVLNTLPEGSQFAQALVIGIALASNVAGMASPIASPQNVVALQSMDPDPNWLKWFGVSLPVCTCALLLIFVYLMFMMDFRGTTIVPIRSTDEKFTPGHYYVLVVSLVTIILWCGASFFEHLIGDMGMIAVASMVAFYAPGVLLPEDFNNYPWTIVMLAMGGLALGKAVTVSGLLRTIAEAIQAQLAGSGLFTVLCLFGIIVLAMATFVSHTVAALIIVPLIAEIGKALPDPHPNLLIMATALLCSSAMGLPTSGFPNVTAIGLRDSVGNPYLTVGTFIKIGVPSSLFCYLVVIFIGYLMMKLLDF
ncbi:hypothetical protein OGAPHI_004017 [Ogataea philodendri]|uniref:SPX domain-containing protein n=1 Tax=Ogataea philodendri TaxID=1378263 RepID=A0A9P8P6F9_9ASCO|nr:uncharacterized protein OGAPHI_004017 [Ogataea philodendri]KAH3665829.1 hypothetical protein OGAPHI_004017 [Ogataea philodendri]